MYKYKFVSMLALCALNSLTTQSMAVIENLLYKAKGFGYTVEGLEKKVVNSFWSPTAKSWLSFIKSLNN